MKNLHLLISGIILFSSFAAISGTFASAHDNVPVVLNVDGHTVAPWWGMGEAINATEPCGAQTMQCTVTWKADSDVCKSQNTASNCTTKYQGEHATLEEAKDRCEHIHGVTLDSGVLSCGPCWVLKSTQGDCLERCKDLCVQLWEKCRDNCPRKDRNCLSECSNALARCNRECDRKCR